ncbi:hypothetical protein KCP75_17275 [Salmonella enterica subsp. enterica]|nr:hypothetical protein KCP75_17275 [Salmonella enterica subsp. enterica]
MAGKLRVAPPVSKRLIMPGSKMLRVGRVTLLPPTEILPLSRNEPASWRRGKWHPEALPAAAI